MKNITKFTLNSGDELEINGISQELYDELIQLIETRSEEKIVLGDIGPVPIKFIKKMQRLK